MTDLQAVARVLGKFKMPIEEAPKDQYLLLQFGGLVGWQIGKWDNPLSAKPFWRTYASYVSVASMRANQPTHFLPIPVTVDEEVDS